jgi:hypothetical protein
LIDVRVPVHKKSEELTEKTRAAVQAALFKNLPEGINSVPVHFRMFM